MTQNRFYSSVAAKTASVGTINASVTTLVVAAATGFPASLPFTLILERDTANEEVVTVTAVSGTTLTISRAQDGTTGVTHTTGAVVEHGVSARDFSEPQAHIAAVGAVHGLVGSIVGTTDIQTLTNKTLTSPTFSGTASGLSALATVIGTYPTLTWVPSYLGITGTTQFSRAIRIGGLVFCQATVSVTATSASIGIQPPTTPVSSATYHQVVGSAEYRTTGNVITTYGLAVPNGGAAFLYSGGGGGGEVFSPGWSSGVVSFSFFYFDA